MSTSFDEMGLAAPLLQALQNLEITQPTPVQTSVVAQSMAGGDYMVSSQTGSGKTFAFLLPVMHRMMVNENSANAALQGPQALVLCPTRELAQQVSQDAINLVKCAKGLRIATVVGGMPYGKQMASLRGANLVVATPGRLLDLAQQGKINLSTVETLIVDEADRMLDLGFAPDLEAIDNLCKNRKQTLMFSATFAKRITGLAEAIMNSPKRIELSASNEANTDVTQKLLWADNRAHKRRLLNHWLEHADVVQAVVFTSTQMDAENLARDLSDEGVRACALHGAMPQVVRNRRLASVRKGDIKILVATDVAARGVWMCQPFPHVINYGMPMKAEDYVHRIGRTGRAGRSGIAITLAEASDIVRVRAIERFINTRIPEEQVEGMEPRGNFTNAPRGAKPGNGGGQRRGSSSGFSNASGSGRPRNDDRPAFRSDTDRPARPAFRSDTDRPARPAFRSDTDRPARPAFRSDTDRPARPAFRSDADRPARPAFRSDTDRPARPAFRSETAGRRQAGVARSADAQTTTDRGGFSRRRAD